MHVMLRLREQGKCRFLGVTETYGRDNRQEMLPMALAQPLRALPRRGIAHGHHQVERCMAKALDALRRSSTLDSDLPEHL